MRLLWFLICKCIGHKLYRVDEGYSPTHRREKCARCGYKTEAYPIETIGPFTVRAYCTNAITREKEQA
jgi:hypothetical protein